MFSLVVCAVKGCKVRGYQNEMLVKRVNGVASYVCWGHNKYK